MILILILILLALLAICGVLFVAIVHNRLNAEDDLQDWEENNNNII